ncbi:uncharacterized protein LOC134684799 [Mytilus trossulus]|uniref:uncharacterized protein LOC134684799 n=1 Tax=Mytilus trossulus TaxID=6551 RepID=UPI003004B11F
MADAAKTQWCEPCGRVGENQQAHSWCSDCSEPLCGECLKFHPKGKSTANHKTIPILKAEKLAVLNIPDTCHIHEEQKLSLFCIQHDQICCAFCLRESHSTCKDVKSIEQASKGVKMGTAIDDVQHRISEFSFMIGKILDVYKNNLSSISDQKDKYKDKIKNIRKEFNTYLDEIEQVIDSKTDPCDKECISEIEKKIKDLTTRKNKLESRQTAIETLTEHASETKIFAAVKTIDLILIEEEVFLSKMQEKLTTYALLSSPCDLMEKIKPILATLSEIRIEQIKTTVQNPLNVQQVQAYKMQQKRPSLMSKISCSQMKMTRIGRACFTIDNHIVFCGNQILLYDITNSSVQSVRESNVLGYTSTNITSDMKNNVYASFAPVFIKTIDMKNLKEGTLIHNSKDGVSDCHNFTCLKAKNDLIYSNYNQDIVSFNEKRSVMKVLKTKVNPAFMCVSKDGGIFISEKNTIKHITESGSYDNIPTKMESGDNITGIDVNEQGQLYACICGNEVGSIVRINTTTGYREPVLENLVTPCDIAFHPDPTKNMFLVMTDHGKECSVYQFAT